MGRTGGGRDTPPGPGKGGGGEGGVRRILPACLSILWRRRSSGGGEYAERQEKGLGVGGGVEPIESLGVEGHSAEFLRVVQQ